MTTSRPVVGSDFDNTIISYRGLFERALAERGHEPPSGSTGKTAIRDALRRRPGGELEWQRIQAMVYGTLVQEASVVPGFEAFVSRCRDRGMPVYVVSHKTAFAAQDPQVNLRERALDWMAARGFFEPGKLGFDRSDIFFCETRKEKLDRIGRLGCRWFVDDMPEVLLGNGFPKETTPILMQHDADPGDPSAEGVRAASTWDEVGRLVFG